MHIRLINGHQKSLRCFTLGLLLVLPELSQANGELVYDPVVAGKIVQETEQGLDTLNETVAQGITLKSQLETAQQQYAAITGHYGWGNWNTQGQTFTNNWQWTASNWQEQLNGMCGGNAARCQELRAQYVAANDSMTEEDFHKTFSAPVSKALANQVSTNQAAGTTSQMSYEQVNGHVTELQSLSQQVEDTDKNTNTKSAIDINTRAQIQNGLIGSEIVRVQTINNNMVASNQAAEIARSVQAAKFNLDPTHN